MSDNVKFYVDAINHLAHDEEEVTIVLSEEQMKEHDELIRAEVIEKFKDSLIDYITNEKAKGNEPYWAVAIRNVAEQLKEQNR